MNSNLMIPFFPHDIGIRLAELKKNLVSWRCFVPCWPSHFSWDSQQDRDRAPSGRNKENIYLIGAIVIMRKIWCVSLNLNSKVFRFHSVRLIVRYKPAKYFLDYLFTYFNSLIKKSVVQDLPLIWNSFFKMFQDTHTN